MGLVGARRPLWAAQRGDHNARIFGRLLRHLFEAGMEVDGSIVYTLLFDSEAKLRAWVTEKGGLMEAAGWMREACEGREVMRSREVT